MKTEEKLTISKEDWDLLVKKLSSIVSKSVKLKKKVSGYLLEQIKA